MILRFIALLLCLFLALPVQADDYIKPSFDNLLKTLVRFSALDLRIDPLLDEYAMVTDCGLYKNFYSDDFKWNQVRAAIRDSVRLNIATFPMSYQYDTNLQLGRYDFQQSLYKFTDKSTVDNVNAFMIYSIEEPNCGGRPIKYLPSTFHAVLDVPVTIPGLPLAESDGRALLHEMEKDGNKDHIVYTRFNLNIVYVEPLRKVSIGENAAVRYSQSNTPASSHSVRLDTRLDSVDFFEDPAMTKLIYSYRP